MINTPELNPGTRILFGIVGGGALIPAVYLGLKAPADHADAQPHTVISHHTFKDSAIGQVCVSASKAGSRSSCAPGFEAQITGAQETTTTHYRHNESLDKQSSAEGSGAIGIAVVSVASLAIAALGGRKVVSEA